MANDPRQLVVLGFDSVLRAEEALLAMTRLSAEGKVLLHDAVFVHRDADGKAHVRETTDPTPGATLDARPEDPQSVRGPLARGRPSRMETSR